MHIGTTMTTSHPQQQAGCSLSFPINKPRLPNETCMRLRVRLEKTGGAQREVTLHLGGR